SHPFFSYIALLKQSDVTKGCTTVQFCPDAPTTRGQMAAFLIRAMLRTEIFSYSPTPYFTDVPANHPFFAYVQKLKEMGVTKGCSPTTYCPDDTVTRGQMAAFLIRAKFGDDFDYAHNQAFTDVVQSDFFYAHAQRLKDEGITNGCGGDHYCGSDPTTRGQMAAFLIRAFFTP